MKPRWMLFTKGIASVAISASVAVAGLSFVGCSGANPAGQSLETSGTSQVVEASPAIVPSTLTERSETKVDHVVTAEANGPIQAREGLQPETNQANPTESGGGMPGVFAQDDAAQTNTVLQVPGGSGSQQTGMNPAESAHVGLLEHHPQSSLSGMAEASIPTLEPTTVHPAGLPEAAPETPLTFSSLPGGDAEVPFGEAGNEAVQEYGGTDPSESVQQHEDNAEVLNTPGKKEQKYPNLGSYLNQLVAVVEAGQTDPEKAAEGATIHRGESVAVTIHLSGHVDQVVTFLEENDGDPRNVGKDYIEAYVPVSLLGRVSEHPGVTRVREIIPPRGG